MTKPARNVDPIAPIAAVDLQLAIGEVWFIRFKGQEQVRKVEIADLRERFVALRHSADGGPMNDGAWLGWFERRRIRWRERIKRRVA